MITWVDGRPDVLARQFLAATGDSVSSLGKVPIYWFVAAVACASVHKVIASSSPERDDRLRNILATAKAIAQAVSKRQFDEDKEIDWEEDDDEDYEIDQTSGSTATVPQAMRELEGLVNQLLQQQDQQPDSDLPSDKPAASITLKGTGSDTRNGLGLPAALVQSIMFRLDIRSAATAAASCKQLAAAYRLKSYFNLPESYQAYQDMIMAFLESMGNWSDGSCEAALVVKWPLDGSAVAGRDLNDDATARTCRSLLPLFGPLLQSLAALPGVVPDIRNILLDKDGTRPPPAPKSTPLASFISSKPVPFNSSISAQVAPEPSFASSLGTKRSRGGSKPEPDLQRSAIPVPPTDALTAACCDIQRVRQITMGHEMHLDGDLLCYGYQYGWKQRDPGFAAAVFGQIADEDTSDAAAPVISSSHYSNGMFDNVRRTCADSANGLVWCAADHGERIKAFRAPEGFTGSGSVDATCNRGEDNGIDLQYTFSSVVKGLRGDPAGLHVIGTKVLYTMSSGVMLTWDVAELEPQQKARFSEHGLDPNAPDSEDGDEKELRYKGNIGSRDTEDCDDVEVTVGTKPQLIYKLQRPSSTNGSRGQEYTSVTRTVLLPGYPVPDTLAAIYSGLNSCTVLIYDLETQCIKNVFMGHLYETEALCPAPAAWPGAENLFATCARSGDVKLWDVRNKGGSAVITLTCGGNDPMTAVALAANRNSSDAATGSSSSSNQLGAGMICFAGGVCESIWAWDLRAGNAQALYQLSVGNLLVNELIWHEGTSTLVASCESLYENRCGSCYEDDFVGLNANGDMPDPFDNYSDKDEDDAEFVEGAKLWPKKAKHNPKDFRNYFHMSHSCVLGYTFSDKASQVLPESSDTHFSRAW